MKPQKILVLLNAQATKRLVPVPEKPPKADAEVQAEDEAADEERMYEEERGVDRCVSDER